MANSDVGICNLALSLLNVPPITSIDPPTTTDEERCALWYDQTRKEALRRHTWNFATKRVILAPSSVSPAFGDGTYFDLPSDFIRLMWIEDASLDRTSVINNQRFQVEGDRILFSNARTSDATQLRLVYVSDFKTVSKMDSMFVRYFYHLLGQNLAYPVTQSNSTVERMNALMESAERVARAMDGQDSPPRRVERSKAIASRFSRGGRQF